MMITNVFINFLQAIIFVAFINSSSTRKKKFSFVTSVLWIFIFTLNTTLLNTFSIHEGWFGLITLFLLFAYCSIISTDTYAKRLVVSCTPYILIGIINSLLLPSLYLFYPSSLTVQEILSHNYLMVAGIGTTLLFIISFILIKPYRKFSLQLSTKYNLYLLLAIVILNLFSLYFEKLFIINKIDSFTYFISFISFDLFTILLIQVFCSIGKTFIELEHKNFEIKIMQSESENYRNILELESNIYSLNHDIKHLLQITKNINLPIPNNILEQYQNNLRELPKNISSDNLFIRYLIRNLYKDADSLGIDCSVSIITPREIAIDNIDFYLILSNLVTNALENCSGAMHINISIKQTEASTIIVIQNTTSKNILLDNPDLKTTKAGNEHGYGISIVRNLVNKYLGELLFYEENFNFIAYVEIQDNK